MSQEISEGAIVVFLMILGYLVMGTCIEKLHLPFGHEASFTILIGMAVSYLFILIKDREVTGLLKFNDNTFFFVCLPPIVFASGFNMQRGNFFANIKNILLFGCITTFISFTIFSILTVEINEKKMMTQYSGKTG